MAPKKLSRLKQRMRARAREADLAGRRRASPLGEEVDKKLVGPAYKDVAAKYNARKDAEAYLTKKIREGSTGVWGPIPMPPNGTVSDDEAKALAKYVLSVK